MRLCPLRYRVSPTVQSFPAPGPAFILSSHLRLRRLRFFLDENKLVPVFEQPPFNISYRVGNPLDAAQHAGANLKLSDSYQT